jgi:hypothetical protein
MHLQQVLLVSGKKKNNFENIVFFYNFTKTLKKNIMKKLLLSLSILLFGLNASAQLTCATATPITANGTLTVPALTGTYETNCFTNTTASSPVGGQMNAIWYQYTATANGNVAITSNLPVNVAPNSDDTRVSVTTGTCGALVCTASNDDINTVSNFLSSVSFPVVMGTTYYIMWDNNWNGNGFDFTFTFSLPPTCAPVTTVNAPSAITMTGATLNWAVPTVVPAMYEIEYGVAPYLLGGGGMTATTSTNSVVLSGLTANETYNYFIRSKCGATDFSSWTTTRTLTLMGVNGELVIYDTTTTSNTGMELTSTANGPATQMGDAILLSGTARYLQSISANFFSLTVATPYTLTMTLYSDCPTVAGAGACGSGVGVELPFSSVSVDVTPTAIGAAQTVEFPFSDFDLTAETDNTITVMVKASRNNVIWTIGETPTIGSMPVGETGNGFVTRCGSTGTNNGCARNFAIPNNARMRVFATETSLASKVFSAKSFTISPNPANDFVTVSAKDNSISNIEMSDLNGRIVKTIKVANVTETQFNISDLASGVYMTKISSENGVAIKKIIKK